MRGALGGPALRRAALSSSGVSTSRVADGSSTSVRHSVGIPARSSRRPTSPIIPRARGYNHRGRMSGVDDRSPSRRAVTRRFAVHQRMISRATSRGLSSARSMGNNSVAPLVRAARKPRTTEVDSPSERSGLAIKETGCPRSSTRMRRARGAVTTTIVCTANGASTAIVLRIRLTPRIFVKAFDRPIRVEKPAANTTMRSLESSLLIIDI